MSPCGHASVATHHHSADLSGHFLSQSPVSRPSYPVVVDPAPRRVCTLSSLTTGQTVNLFDHVAPKRLLNNFRPSEQARLGILESPFRTRISLHRSSLLLRGVVPPLRWRSGTKTGTSLRAPTPPSPRGLRRRSSAGTEMGTRRRGAVMPQQIPSSSVWATPHAGGAQAATTMATRGAPPRAMPPGRVEV